MSGSSKFTKPFLRLLTTFAGIYPSARKYHTSVLFVHMFGWKFLNDVS